jgi:hypothetical protein
MAKSPAKITPELQQTLDSLTNSEEIDVLLYPKQLGGKIEAFLQAHKEAGQLKYNILQLAGCIVVKAPKKLILEIAKRDDVIQLMSNPKFSTQ